MEFIDDLLGLKDGGLESYQMVIRAVLVYFAVLLMIRIGNKRFLGKLTSLDIILAIILGSIVSRGVTGSAPLIPTLIAAAALVVLHSVLSYIALKNDFVGRWLKGKSKCLIKEGRIDREMMQKSRISEEDIMTAARRKGINEIEDIEEAYLEKNGDISIIKK